MHLERNAFWKKMNYDNPGYSRIFLSLAFRLKDFKTKCTFLEYLKHVISSTKNASFDFEAATKSSLNSQYSTERDLYI